jgi:hypothetical protein
MRRVGLLPRANLGMIARASWRAGVESVDGSIRGTMREHWRLRRLTAAALIVMVAAGGLVGCMFRDLPIVGVSETRAPGDFSTSAARQVFAMGLDNIDRVYIEPVAVSTVALHGLQALS